MIDPAQPGPGLLDLPPGVLDQVFCLALRLHLAALADDHESPAFELRKRDPRRVLPLVSRAFLAAAAEAASLWHRVQLNLLTLSAESAPRLVRWLGGHAPTIRCLVLYGRALPSVETALWGQVDALAAAVQRAGQAGLEQLDLPGCLGAAVLARVRPLELHRLKVVGVDLASSSRSRVRDRGSADSGSSGSTAGSSSLRQRRQGQGGAGAALALAVDVTGSQLSEVECATVNLLLLPALSELLVQSRLEARLLSAHPGAWQQLRRLHFADCRDVPRGPLLGPLASLRALTSLRFYQRDGFRLPGPLTALTRLVCLHAAVRYQDDPLVVGEGLTTLTSLQALWLQYAAFEAPPALAALPRLHSLALVGGTASWAPVLAGFAAAGAEAEVEAEQPGRAVMGAGAGGGAAATAAADGSSGSGSFTGGSTSGGASGVGRGGDESPPQPQAQPQPQKQPQPHRQPLQLRALHLEGHAMSVAEVPAEAWRQLARLGGGLTRLELPYNRLTQLAPGPYLTDLQVLDLSQNSLSCVPPSLAACAALRALSLGQQEAAALGEGGADVVLLRALPALRLLASSAGHYSSAHLAAGLRSPAEAAHLERLRAALPAGVRVTNRQSEWERGAGRLAELFEVSLRQQGRPASGA